MMVLVKGINNGLEVEIIMIKLTKINNDEFVLNCDLIETVEETPDTIITLNNGKKFVVKEPSQVVVQMVVDFKRRIFNRF